MSMSAEDRRDAPMTLSSIVAGIATAMRDGRLGQGELAELRRLDVDAPDRTAFWKVIVGNVKGESLTADQETGWAIILSGMARMAPLHHNPGNSIGRALAEAGVKEGRLMRLLRSHGPTFHDSFRRICGLLAARGLPVDWAEMASLVLTRDSDRSEHLRRGIARDYYSALQRKE